MQQQVQPATEGRNGTVATGGGEFLTFRLGGESYGIEILKVQEIRGYEAPTAIANAPAFIKGVINLRGVIVPILDLRIKFQMPEARYDEFTVAIILTLGAGDASAATVSNVWVEGVQLSNYERLAAKRDALLSYV